MCIIKLHLETECPELARDFADKHLGLRNYPITLTKENIHEHIVDEKRYRELLIYPTKKLDSNNNIFLAELTDDDRRFLCNSIRKGFYEYTSDEYQRDHFSVEIVDNCDASWSNGKVYYVFPTAYDKSPILNF